MRWIFLCLLCGIALSVQSAEPNMGEVYKVDDLSYKLGSIAAFAEMVGAGVKPLGLSSPMSAADLDQIESKARDIAGRYNAQVYREKDFLVTDLFPESVTAGKEVLVLATREALEGYHALKKKKQGLIKEGTYQGDKREGIAREFGTLLGYPEWRIDELLSK